MPEKVNTYLQKISRAVAERSNWLARNLRKIGATKNPLETIAGAAILAIALYFFSWGVLTARTSNTSGYTLIANFANTGGIGRGADVSVSGVRIGQVSGTLLNQDDYTVDIIMTIENSFKLPKDTTATISTAGLIGDKYIALEIGGSKEMAGHGARLRSQPFKPIEEIIGDFIFKEGKR